MNILKFLPEKNTKTTKNVLDLELLKVLSESEAYGWWLDYLKRYSNEPYVENLSFDDDYLANVTLQAS